MSHITFQKMQKKIFDKIQHPCTLKALKKPKIEGTYLYIIKAVYDKPITNIVQHGENLKTFPLSSETSKGW
jgi:hypothetical protein